MNTIPIHTTHSVRRLALIAIVAALVLSFAAITTLGSETDVTGEGFSAQMGDYLTQVGGALGGG